MVEGYFSQRWNFIFLTNFVQSYKKKLSIQILLKEFNIILFLFLFYLF